MTTHAPFINFTRAGSTQAIERIYQLEAQLNEERAVAEELRDEIRQLREALKAQKAKA